MAALADAVRLYSEGSTYLAAAGAAGVSLGDLHAALTAAGVPRRTDWDGIVDHRDTALAVRAEMFGGPTSSPGEQDRFFAVMDDMFPVDMADAGKKLGADVQDWRVVSRATRS